jgi:HAMP domain-containing protein
VWRVKLVAGLRPGEVTETEVARIERYQQAGTVDRELRMTGTDERRCSCVPCGHRLASKGYYLVRRCAGSGPTTARDCSDFRQRDEFGPTSGFGSAVEDAEQRKAGPDRFLVPIHAGVFLYGPGSLIENPATPSVSSWDCEQNMGLRTKFNLAVLVAFIIGFAGSGLFLQRLFIENARQQVLQNARIMMSSADSIRRFTDVFIEPLAEAQNKSGSKFIAASVPSFAAQTTFKDVQTRFPDFTYREPTLNPTNPTDRPSDWEADYINAFRNKPELKELTGDRETPTGRVLSLAQPIRINDPNCLTCHSTPSAAPASMLATYGQNNGFGWHLHEAVGAQVVSVPMALPLEQARQTFTMFMAILLGVFAIIVIILNVLLHYTVIRPVVKLSRMANAVSLGDATVEEYERKGRDEIAVLSNAFNRMRRSLDSAMRMLDP